MSGVLLAAASAFDVYLIYTAVALGWRGARPLPRMSALQGGRRTSDWLAQAGLHEVGVTEFVLVVSALAVVGALLGFALFGGAIPAGLSGLLSGCLPVASYRNRRQRRLEEARDAWPRLIEDIRLQTGGLGRSIPQALFDAGRRAPQEMQPAFAAAEREWQVSTDFARTLTVLKGHLADPTADTVCETLLVAHMVGGTGLDRRLGALIEDRIQELEGRRDALAKQAGARFARRFVLLVPLGMAVAGLSIGGGRGAYGSPAGQVAVAVAIAAVVGCWAWAGRLMRLPEIGRAHV